MTRVKGFFVYASIALMMIGGMLAIDGQELITAVTCGAAFLFFGAAALIEYYE